MQRSPEIAVWKSDYSGGLSAFSVFVSDVSFTSTDIATTRNQPGVSEYTFAGTAGHSERFAHGGTGRYVRVQLHATGVLALSEVEVGGPFNEILAEPIASYGVRGLEPSLSTKEDQEVWAIEQIGGTIFAGGRFSEVINRRNAEVVHDQPFIAAFDADTGTFIDFWRPDLDGAVFSMEASPDGSRLFVGGEFTNVDGIPHTSGLVALDPQTGHVDPTWRASLEKRFVVGPPTVRNMVVANGWLYVVGNFTTALTFPNLDAVNVKNSARVSVTNGALDTGWKPQITGGAAWGVAVSPDNTRVYLVGKFTDVNGTADSAWFHTVNTSNAASVGGLQPLTFFHSQRDQRDVIAVGDRVWVGGAQHYLQMLDAGDLSLIEGLFTGTGPPPGGLTGGGDTQDLELVGDRIYTTCHCWLDGGSRLWEHGPDGLGGFEAIPLDYAWGNMAFDSQTGEYISQFGSDPDDFQGELGGWAIHGGADGCLWFGGDFNDATTGGQYPNGIMKQCPEDGPGPNSPPISQAAADTTSPSTPTNVAVTLKTNQRVQITWGASSDNDAVAGYYVYRDGQQIVGTAGTKLLYTESPGIEHTWTVRAIDPSQNLSSMSAASNAVTVAIPPGYAESFLEEHFAVEDGGFIYSDDSFRGTSEPAYASGPFDVTGGKTDGGLGIRTGGIDDDDIFGMSGGWAKSFTLNTTDVELSFVVRTQIASAYEADEYIEALVRVDGLLACHLTTTSIGRSEVATWIPTSPAPTAGPRMCSPLAPSAPAGTRSSWVPTTTKRPQRPSRRS